MYYISILLVLFIALVYQSDLVPYLYCKYYECCSKPWISNDINNLTISLRDHLFGQHIVKGSVPKLIKAHVTNSSPQKPLVLSFHGGTGTGKTWVGKLIAESLYSEGLNSKFVVFISVPHFFRDTTRSREFTEQLHKWIQNSLNSCTQTLFIFEDIHTMSPKILDGLLPYINYPLPIRGIDFNRAIYILLSNSGATKINNYVIEQYSKGRVRSTIGEDEMHNVLSDEIYAEEGAFKNTEFVSRHVIDTCIPFLPLAKVHVERCIENAMIKRGVTPRPSSVNEVLKNIQFFPKKLEWFSESGCKRIDQLISDFV